MKRKYEVAVRQKALIALERDKLLEQVHMSYASVISQEGTNHILLFLMKAQTKSLEQVHVICICYFSRRHKPHFLAYASVISQGGTNHIFLHMHLKMTS